MSDILERQLFDMNCNDCVHMVRSISRRQQHVDIHYKMQKSLFDVKRLKMIKAGEQRLVKGEKDKAKAVFKEARKMKFVFDEGSCTLSYGSCTIKQKTISFVPEIVMEENFNCFKHRKS